MKSIFLILLFLGAGVDSADLKEGTGSDLTQVDKDFLIQKTTGTFVTKYARRRSYAETWTGEDHLCRRDDKNGFHQCNYAGNIQTSRYLPCINPPPFEEIGKRFANLVNFMDRIVAGLDAWELCSGTTEERMQKVVHWSHDIPKNQFRMIYNFGSNEDKKLVEIRGFGDEIFLSYGVKYDYYWSEGKFYTSVDGWGELHLQRTK